MRFLLFEDDCTSDLNPIALTRPTFELICGRESLRRRLERWFPDAEWGAWVRPYLADSYREERQGPPVNDATWLSSGRTFLINGCWLPEGPPLSDQGTVWLDNAGYINDRLAWIVLEPEEAGLLDSPDFIRTLHGIAGTRTRVTASGEMLRYPWDFVNRNFRQLEKDFHSFGASELPHGPGIEVLGDHADIYVSQESQIDPFVVLDATLGPISIDRDVRILPFTRIEGPCHIGAGSQLFRAHVRAGTTIGENCRVGGEIEASVLHGFVNKYHEGFLGHSYVCPWVNMGAQTTTSDLKNDYSTVSVSVGGSITDTRTTKIGSFIGDHTRTAIDSMFNTGTSIGVMAMVLPGGRLLPRHIPSFCNLNFGELAADWPLQESLKTAGIAMNRRGKQLTPALIRLFRHLFDATEDERNTALNRAANRRIARRTDTA